MQVKVEVLSEAISCLEKGFKYTLEQAARADGLKAHLKSAHTIFALHISQQGHVPVASTSSQKVQTSHTGSLSHSRQGKKVSKDGTQPEWLYQSSLTFVDLACCETLKPHGAARHYSCRSQIHVQFYLRASGLQLTQSVYLVC